MESLDGSGDSVNQAAQRHSPADHRWLTGYTGIAISQRTACPDETGATLPGASS